MDIQDLKKRIDDLDPTIHRSLHESLTAEYDRVKSQGQSGKARTGQSPEHFLTLYQTAVDEIGRRYIDGTIPFITKQYPDFDREISLAEDEINDIWKSALEGKATLEQFRLAVGKWYRLNLRAIRIYARYLEKRKT